MALKLDNTLLEELGLGALPEGEKQLLLRQIYEKLEMNVGMKLADQMSNEQLDEFEKFVDSNDDKGAFQWLETNFPNYKDVVNQEFEKLKVEIKQYAPQMLAVASQNAAGAGASGQPQPVVGQPGVQPQQQPGYVQQGQVHPGQQYQQPYPQPQPGQPYSPVGQPQQYPQQQPNYGQPQPASQQMNPGQQQQYQASPQYPPAPSLNPQPQHHNPQPPHDPSDQPTAGPGQQPYTPPPQQ